VIRRLLINISYVVSSVHSFNKFIHLLKIHTPGVGSLVLFYTHSSKDDCKGCGVHTALTELHTHGFMGTIRDFEFYGGADEKRGMPRTCLASGCIH